VNYVLHIAILITLYIILGQSLNLLVGFTGLLSLAHAAFFGLGAYVSTLLMIRADWPFLAATGGGCLVAMTLSLVVAVPSLRLRGDFFVLATLGFQMIIFSVFNNWTEVTRGPYGIAGIPKPKVFGLTAHTLPQFVILACLIVILVLVVHWRLTSTPYGRTLKAIRDQETAARALGKNVLWFKTSVFMIAGGVAAIAGALYAGYVTYIDPTSFTLDESIFILTIVIVGGAGNLRGPVIGAFVLVLLPEALRFLHVPDTVAPNLRQIIYGILLITMMRIRPSGLAGQYAFD